MVGVVLLVLGFLEVVEINLLWSSGDANEHSYAQY
jgi:hypothetical protein